MPGQTHLGYCQLAIRTLITAMAWRMHQSRQKSIGRTTTMHTRRPRQGFLWPGASFILLFNGLLLCWLLVQPGGHDLTVAVDDILQVLGPLLALPLCLVGGR